MKKNNNLAKIRNNINQRKLQRKKGTVVKRDKTNPLAIRKMEVEDEERHGFYPTTSSYSNDSNNTPFFRFFLLRSVIAATIFFLTALSMTADVKWLEKPKQWTSYALSEEFPFASVNAWYQAKFGAPLALENNLEEDSEELAVLPVYGQVNQSFRENGKGIRITADNETEVVAVKGGTVLFAGNDRETGKTVIIQHPDRTETIYGSLTSIDVHSYQSVKGNQKIGTYEPSEENESMYFAVKKNQQFLDPVQVIQVDEQ